MKIKLVNELFMLLCQEKKGTIGRFHFDEYVGWPKKEKVRC